MAGNKNSGRPREDLDRLRKIPSTFQLSWQVKAIIDQYAELWGIPKQVAVEQLVMKGFKSSVKGD